MVWFHDDCLFTYSITFIRNLLKCGQRYRRIYKFYKYVRFKVKSRETFLFFSFVYIIRVRISFLLFDKSRPSHKVLVELPHVKRNIVRLLIWEHYTIFFVRKYQVLCQISVTCRKVYFFCLICGGRFVEVAKSLWMVNSECVTIPKAQTHRR